MEQRWQSNMIIAKGITLEQFIKVWEEAKEAMERIGRYSKTIAIGADEMVKVDWGELATMDWKRLSKTKCPMEVDK